MTAFSARFPRKPAPSLTLLWSRGVGIGACATLVALLCAARYFVATVALTYCLAIMMAITALLHIREAFGPRRRPERSYWLASGAPYLAAALLLFTHPMIAGARTALILAACIGLSGLARVALAIAAHPICRIWLYLSGAVSLAVAMGIGFGWPFASASIAVRALALDLAVQGAVLVLLEARRAHPTHGLARLGRAFQRRWR